MADETDRAPLPTNPLARARLLEDLVLDCATYCRHEQAWAYEELRRGFVADPSTRALLPAFVRDGRDRSQVRAYAQQLGGYKDRRQHIWEAFKPFIDHLEAIERVPLDAAVGQVLAAFNAESVHDVWTRALARREQDPEGAITMARTLMETVCKHVLDAQSVVYKETEDLPALYGKTARALNLAPSQHTEEAFRRVLGGCQAIVETLGTIRNRIGDAHGHSKPVRPAPRHAALAVNLAGTMATFLVETWQAKNAGVQS